MTNADLLKKAGDLYNEVLKESRSKKTMAEQDAVWMREDWQDMLKQLKKAHMLSTFKHYYY